MEQLDVEGEATQHRRLEERLGDVGPEGLEPTLRVAVLAQQQRVGGQVHQPATHLAKATGPHQRGGVGVSPAAHHEVVSLLDPSHQCRGLGGPVCQIGIGEHHGSTRCHGDPSPHRCALAPVAIQPDHSICSGRLCNRRGVVRRSVVDHHHLDVIDHYVGLTIGLGERYGQLSSHPGDRLGNPVGLSVGGKHDGHPHVTVRRRSLRRVVLFPPDHPEQERPVGHRSHQAGHQHGDQLGREIDPPIFGGAGFGSVQQRSTGREDGEIDQPGHHDDRHEDALEADPAGVRVVAQRHRPVQQAGRHGSQTQSHDISRPRRPTSSQ